MGFKGLWVIKVMGYEGADCIPISLPMISIYYIFHCEYATMSVNLVSVSGNQPYVKKFVECECKCERALQE
jgi:hypothetical protein